MRKGTELEDASMRDMSLKAHKKKVINSKLKDIIEWHKTCN